MTWLNGVLIRLHRSAGSDKAVNEALVMSIHNNCFLRERRIIQSTLVISNSKGLSEILRDIRTSTYQICRIKEKVI